MSRLSRIVRLMFVAVFLTLPLGACAMTDTARAQRELKRMKAESYFSDPIQAEFVDAIGSGDLAQAQRLLESGASVNAVGTEGMTPLYWAILKQNFSSFEFLLENSANPNTSTCWKPVKGPEQCESALQIAILQDDSRYLSALLDGGADPNQTIDSSKRAPIYIAILYRRLNSIRVLAARGANLNHQDFSLKTPISDAVSMNAFAAALLLLQLGADPTIKSRWGSAVDTVKQFGNAGTVIGSDDEKAYPEFIAELKRRGFW